MKDVNIDFLLIMYIALMVTALAIGEKEPEANPCPSYGMGEHKKVLISNKLKHVTFVCSK
jgi:hypothetical protein